MKRIFFILTFALFSSQAFSAEKWCCVGSGRSYRSGAWPGPGNNYTETYFQGTGSTQSEALSNAGIMCTTQLMLQMCKIDSCDIVNE